MTLAAAQSNSMELDPKEFTVDCRPHKGLYTYKVLHKPTGISSEAQSDTIKGARNKAVKILFKMIHDIDYQKDPTIFDDISPELLKKFKECHTAHPEIYQQFKAMAYQMKSRAKRYSHITIFEVIRWNTDIRGGDRFKINNNYRSVYVRLLIYNHPEFKDFFEKRSHQTDKVNHE